MALATQPYSGTRDWYPEDKRLQKHLASVMRTIAERFGYEEYDTPLLEHAELYITPGDETLLQEETFTFTDQEGSTVVIRPDMTPAVSRLVARKRQKLAFPLRWYSLPVLLRNSEEQREQQQLNVDIFGIANPQAEIELLQLADAILKAYGASHDAYVIKLSSRKLMDFIFNEYLELSGVQTVTIRKLIRQLDTIPLETFTAEIDALFTPSQREQGASNKLLGLLRIKSIDHLPASIREHPAALELKKLLQLLRNAKVHNVMFDLAISYDEYHTGTIFEISSLHPEYRATLLGGGRYDGLPGQLTTNPVAAVGFALNYASLEQFLKAMGLLPKVTPETDLYILLAPTVRDKAQRIIDEIRDTGVNAIVGLDDKNTDEHLEIARKKGLRYVLFIGEKELSDEQYELKNLLTGASERRGLARTISIIKDYRGQQLAED